MPCAKSAMARTPPIQGLRELCDHEGAASHGKDAFAPSLGPAHAEMAARAADAVLRFLWSVHRDGLDAGTRHRVRYDELEDFNEWMDTVAHDGPIQIFEVEYRQSEVFFKLDPDAYRDALARFEEMEEEEQDAEL